MADRYTRKDAEAAFARLASALGKTWSDRNGDLWRGKPYQPEAAGTLWAGVFAPDGKRLGNRAQVGAWALDYAAPYGGFVVHEMHNEGGGVGCPLGHTRHNAREFCALVRFTLDALRVIDEARSS